MLPHDLKRQIRKQMEKAEDKEDKEIYATMLQIVVSLEEALRRKQ